MKYHLILSLLFFSFPLFSQEKGVSPLTPKSEIRNPKSTFAVVVGISDYQDEGIPDLRFADKDAEAFAAWLQSPAGGKLAPNQLQLLLNKEATLGRVGMALTWLLEQSQEGDLAVIYFSGHGDVEKNIFNQPGFLLCHDAPPVVYWSGGSLHVNIFQEIITTLSLVNKSQVLLITDACRAGKLAGTSYNGSQLTTSSLAKQFAKEIKILSCQPNEYSIEGEQWGGGRGAFSYHLENGLYGLADRDGDMRIKLKEIGRYLEDNVPAETDPQVQNPVVVGDREALIALVDEGALAQKKAENEQRLPAFHAADMRGAEELILAKADTSIQQIYEAFVSAVDDGNLMSPVGASANDYYEILIHDPRIEELHGLLKRNFVAALVDESQEVTNKLLKTDPDVVSDTWSRPFVFDHIPAYLDRATEILGEGHFFYNYLKAKQYFFEAKNCRKEYYPNLSPDSLVKLAAAKMEKGLIYDSSAAFIYVDLGLLYWFKLGQLDKSRACAQKALELSPNWVYAHHLAGRSFWEDSVKSNFHYQKALELDSTFLLTYQELSLMNNAWGAPEKSAYYRDKYIQKVKDLIKSNPSEVPVYYITLLGAELWRSEKWDEAEAMLLQAEKLSNYQDFTVYQYLASVYGQKGKYKEALRAGEKQVELAPFNPVGYGEMAFNQFILNQYDEAINTLEKALSILDSNSLGKYQIAEFQTLLGELYKIKGNYAKAEQSFEKAMDQLPLEYKMYSDRFYVQLHFGLGEVYMKTGQTEKAKGFFQQIIQGFPEPEDVYLTYYIGRAFMEVGNMETLEKFLDQEIKTSPDNPEIYFVAASLYSINGQDEKALAWIERAFQKGYDTFDRYSYYQVDKDLLDIRQTPAYKSLLGKHFPDQNKN